MYNWQAIQSKLSLPDATDLTANDFWIWNEGTPEDIPVFKGRRVILLSKASYQRSWRSQRMFANLKADLEIERELAREEIDDWLQEILLAKNTN